MPKAMKIRVILGSLTGSMMLLLGCTNDVDTAVYPIVPTLNLGSQSATSVVSYQDTLQLSINYTDGDGDLGGFDEGSALHVKDSRLETSDSYSLERFTPAGETLSIRGSLSVLLGPYFRLGNASIEVVTLELWLTDRNGHESNRIQTAPITITD